MGYNLAFVKKTAIKIFSKVPFTIKVSAMTTWPGKAKPIKVDKKLCIAFSPEFLKAEAMLRKGDKPGAVAAYKKGIELNFQELRTNYEASVPTARRMTDAQRDAYLNNPLVVPAAADLTLSHIMMQKYISMYGWGVTEVWVDMRRFHYTDLDPVTGQQVYREFAPPTGIDLYTNNLNKWIYRVRPRYNSEYLYNVDELNRLGAFAPDYITKECW